MLPGERWNEFLVHYATIQIFLTDVTVGTTFDNFQLYGYVKDTRDLRFGTSPC